MMFYRIMLVMFALEIMNCVLMIDIVGFTWVAIVLMTLCGTNFIALFIAMIYTKEKRYYEGQKLLKLLLTTMPLIFIPVIISEFYVPPDCQWFRIAQDIFEAIIVTGILLIRKEIIGHYICQIQEANNE